eukprot:s33_g47.t1
MSFCAEAAQVLGNPEYERVGEVTEHWFDPYTHTAPEPKGPMPGSKPKEKMDKPMDKPKKKVTSKPFAKALEAKAKAKGKKETPIFCCCYYLKPAAAI